jgi:hypothetical protein
MSKRRIAVATLAAALAGAGSVAVAQQPAAAEVRYIHDKAHDGDDNGDGKNDVGDVKRVRIGHGKDWVYIKSTPHKGAFLGDFDDYFIDTKLKNPGPEFVVQTNTDYGDWFRVHRTEKFSQVGKATCPSGRVHYDHETQQYRFRIPRECLRSRAGTLPGTLRVSVHTVTVFGGPGDGDWAPGKRKFGPWVGVG